jgi:hypothetical protein
MELETLVTESECCSHMDRFGICLQVGKQSFQKCLRERFQTKQTPLVEYAHDCMRLRNHPELCKRTFQQLESLQNSETTLLNHVESETSKTADSQIMFQGTHTKVFNSIPFLLTIFVYAKIWIAPLMALCMPFVLCIMPYIIMITVMEIPIPWDTYITMMKQMVFGIQSGEPWKFKQIMQVLWTGSSLLQGMIQPFVTAYHTYHLDQSVCKRGYALIELVQTGNQVLRMVQSIGCFQGPLTQFPEVPSDPRQAAAWIQDEPLGMKLIWDLLGKLSVFVSISHEPLWTPVSWTQSETCTFTDVYDLAIPREKAVKSTVTIQTHNLLTGPNRGGKSSNLRAILQQLLLGQTFGMTFGTRGSWKPFGCILTRLKSRDHAGKESLFEMEVRVASSMIRFMKRHRSVRTLILIDELFHSTNPPDAEISAKLFLRQLWELPNCTSLVSTHIFSLCDTIQNSKDQNSKDQNSKDQQPSRIQLLCCPAVETESGIQYSYKIQPGICTVSSVKEVLREAGLCA